MVGVSGQVGKGCVFPEVVIYFIKECFAMWKWVALSENGGVSQIVVIGDDVV